MPWKLIKCCEEIHKFRVDVKNENHSGNAVSGSNRWLNLKDISTMRLFQREREMLTDVCKGLLASSWTITQWVLLVSGLFLVYSQLDHKGGWALKNWCFRTVMLETILHSPLDSKEIKPVNPKGNQPWILTGMLKLKLQYSGHLMERANSLKKTLMLGKIESRGTGW